MAAECNYDIDNKFCTLATCCLEQGFVDYLPDVPTAAAYLSIFAIFFFIQIGQGIYYRTWIFGCCMAAGLLLEVLGYAGRLQMSQGNNIFLLSPFLLYLIPLTIGPAFLSAAIYVTLGRTVVVYGSHYSRFQPQTYTYVFVSFDFVALVLQAVGGSLCSVADNPDLLNKGINIMIAGLAFQVFSLLCFIVTSVFFLTAVRRSGMAPNPKFTQLQNSFKFRVAFQIAIAIATLAIFIRCVYRVAELQGGFDSSLANNETIFDVLEGPMIMIASLALTVYHPGYAFQGQFGVAAWKQHGKKKQAESGIEDATLERKSADMSE